MDECKNYCASCGAISTSEDPGKYCISCGSEKITTLAPYHYPERTCSNCDLGDIHCSIRFANPLTDAPTHCTVWRAVAEDHFWLR